MLQAFSFGTVTRSGPLADFGAAKDAIADASLTCRVIATRADLDALETDWNGLFERCGRGTLVFQSFNWTWHWANNFLGQPGGSCELAIITVRRGGNLVALWPLVVARHLGLRFVHWLGEPVSQYGDALVDPAEDLGPIAKASWQAIAGLHADVLYLRKVRADAAVLALLAPVRATKTAIAEATFLDIASAPEFARYEQRYSAKARKNRRRLARRLAGHGTVRLDYVTGGAAGRQAAREAVALKRRTLDETGRVSTALAQERFAAFFADAVSSERPCGARVSRMMVGDALAATSIDITAFGHRAVHIIAHDREFEACGPGVLMVEDWVRTACADGIAVLDLLAPVHSYKWDWADNSIAVVDYAVPQSVWGRWLAVPYLKDVRPRLKQSYERWAQWWTGLRRKQRPAPAAADTTQD